MKNVCSLLVLSISLFHQSSAQDTITYNVHFPNAVHHEAEIMIRLENPSSVEIKAVMSRSSPGRYAVHDFGKNIYNIKAYDDNAVNIPIKRTKPDAWIVSPVNKALNISYTLYANYADGTYSGIDSDFASLNMPATLLWIEGKSENPIKVIFNLPDTSSWKIATQLTVLDSAGKVYFAPNLQYLMDSPCLLSNFTSKEFKIGQENRNRIRMAINPRPNEEEINHFVAMTKDVINEQMQIFGELPTFRDNTYTFLISSGDGFHGDGMEHRNSTVITSAVPLSGNHNRFIGTVSHEFFHVWNMERIRPAPLEPFDFTQASVSGELWFGEGFTSYYGNLTLRRAGLLSEDRYINSLSSKINYLVNAPGWKYGSPVHMSEMAPYTDQASSIDEDNFSNTFLSYYTYGELIALALDLSLRTGFNTVSLDDFMKSMWTKYGVEETPYTNRDLQHTLAEVCKDDEFATDFFETHIFGNELPDFENMFDKFGYKLIKKNPGKPSLGFVRFRFEGDTAILLSPPLVESALYEAGVNKGDLILSIDDQAVTSYPELNFIVGTRKIDDEISVSYSHFGRLKTGSFKLKEDNQLVLIPKEKFSIRVSEQEQKLRAEWLGSRITLK